MLLKKLPKAFIAPRFFKSWWYMNDIFLMTLPENKRDICIDKFNEILGIVIENAAAGATRGIIEGMKND